MTANQSKIVKSFQDKTLTAYGYRLMNRIIDKAAKANGCSRYHAEFKPMKEKVINSILSLVFEQNISAENLSALNKIIKVKEQNNGISTSEILINFSK